MARWRDEVFKNRQEIAIIAPNRAKHVWHSRPRLCLGFVSPGALYLKASGQNRFSRNTQP
jgi:hypothetical protein